MPDAPNPAIPTTLTEWRQFEKLVGRSRFTNDELESAWNAAYRAGQQDLRNAVLGYIESMEPQPHPEFESYNIPVTDPNEHRARFQLPYDEGEHG